MPDSAAINEAVKLAKKRGFSGLSGFVNGVLRSVARGWKNISFPDLSTRFSVPEWIVDEWIRDYGKEKTEQIVDGIFHTDAPMSAAEQKETFQDILSDALDKDCSYDVLQSVHEQLRERLAEPVE